MPELPGKLTLEQQFQLQVLSDQVKNLSHEQCVEYAVECMRLIFVKGNLVDHLMKQNV